MVEADGSDWLVKTEGLSDKAEAGEDNPAAVIGLFDARDWNVSLVSQ